MLLVPLMLLMLLMLLLLAAATLTAKSSPRLSPQLHDFDVEDMETLCPQTLRILRSIPRIYRHSMFSAITPGASDLSLLHLCDTLSRHSHHPA
jgi:hypothetical protein